MEGRVNPQTGMPVCMRVNACAVTNSDVLFATDSAHLTANGRAQLEQFFRSAGAFAYAIYGHTDARASDEYNIRLSQARAESVANVAHGVGACVAREFAMANADQLRPMTAPPICSATAALKSYVIDEGGHDASAIFGDCPNWGGYIFVGLFRSRPPNCE